MHEYLRSIGFKGILKKADLKELLYEVIEYPDEQKIVKNEIKKENIVELKKEFVCGMGIIVRGYYTEEGNFEREYYFPYTEGSGGVIEEETTVARHSSQESFAGVCEDSRSGVTIIYYLQNGLEYLEKVVLTNRNKTYFRGNVQLSALSVSGMILFPINKNKKQIERYKKEDQYRRKLLSAAKMGDETAIESLTIEDIDTYSKISRRIRREDVFTIVDSCFMPYGVECDQYSVIGDILEVKSGINHYTGELVYNLSIECNEFKMNVGINREDLMGEPSVGMRFKGAIWLMGKISFQN